MEKKIVKIIAAVFSLVILLIILTTCFSATEKYYEDVAYQANNLPKGINEISELDGNKRYYKIRSYGGRILSLSSHDYDGTLRVIDFEERNAAKVDFEYDQDGYLIKAVKYDTDLKIVKTITYKPNKKKK
ncbi:MAG: hypothetical protein BWY32_00999 [bacterium ADurb.Bin243]|nr:MAG: hypothetical protein BWY32_00999 [bacterium ADurb.Bin243]HOD39737.1 hypothetical protein [Candidatus Wallbacteria bacterium]